MRQRGRRTAAATIMSLAFAAFWVGVPSAQASSGFEAGAASADITPPAYTTESDSAFVPECGISPAQVSELWPGPRQFQFERPYIDTKHLGRYAVGDPYCGSGAHRYEAPYLAGGSGENRWPTAVDPGNGPQARAVVFSVGASRVALVSVDSIGLFNVTMQRIREEVQKMDPTLTQIFISSTHDESAPDPLGLWGPGTEEPESPTAISSGVDEYYFNFMVPRVADAVVAADHARQRAKLDVAIGSMPSNVQSCWSSYPFIDNQSMPVMQARGKHGHVIFTLVDVSTHAETLAFSGESPYVDTLSADWPGKMRAALEARWPGSVGIEVAGMVGSVETPTVYEPESTQVLRLPGALHGVNGNPNGCSSVYPNPSSGTPVSDAEEFLSAYGDSVANAASSALASGHKVVPRTLITQQQPLCIELENNLFKAAFAADLLPDRPSYANSECTVETKVPSAASAGTATAATPSTPEAEEPIYLKSGVGVVTLGPLQFAYSPGEVFPFTEISGPIDEAQMPFPTNCYEPSTENFYCGTPLPMTPWTSSEMTGRYRFLVGLGEDMIGYMFPPGNFVGTEGEATKEPWVSYEDTKKPGGDRFGYGHSDDAESVGAYAGLKVTTALQQLLASDGPGLSVVPGLYVDSAGHLADSPFASGTFTGAVGVEVLEAGQTVPRELLIGHQAKAWATLNGVRDPGTPGTSLPYSVSTRGVMLKHHQPLLIDVFEGAKALLGQ
jgi:hypothetical protein